MTNTEPEVDTFRCDGLKVLTAVDAMEWTSEKVVATLCSKTPLSWLHAARCKEGGEAT